MNLKILPFIVFAMLLPQSALGIKISGLYQATVAVDDQSSSTHKTALEEGLRQVLVKLTGDPHIGKNKDMATLLQNPKRYVQQFRYRQNKREEDQEQAATEIWIQFDENTINRDMRHHGLFIWGKDRPSILIWLAYEDNAVRYLAGFDDKKDYLKWLNSRAMERGLALLFPLFDLEDAANIQIGDVWAGFDEPVLKASERYRANMVLTGRLVQVAPTRWETRWTGYLDENKLTWNTHGELPRTALMEGITELADRLAARYANAVSSDGELINVSVLNVKSIDDYAKALSFFETLQAVISVNIKHVVDDKVVFQLVSQAGIDVIEQTIKLNKNLVRVDDKQQIVYKLLR